VAQQDHIVVPETLDNGLKFECKFFLRVIRSLLNGGDDLTDGLAAINLPV
jgi:hypothetical protein